MSKVLDHLKQQLAMKGIDSPETMEVRDIDELTVGQLKHVSGGFGQQGNFTQSHGQGGVFTQSHSQGNWDPS